MISKKILLQANKIALRYFCESLNKSDKAKKYLFDRLSKETIKKFYVGYAPKKGLASYLDKCNIAKGIAEKAGLINLNDDGSAYDTFTNRIIFPVFNNKHVVGFGGRTLINHDIKYLNSKATPLYNKGALLYILDFAKKYIEELGYAILVEGYFDVLALIDHGIKNVVGTCGTAFRSEHCLLLRRWTDEIYLCFDGDQAGRLAQGKAINVLKHANIYGGEICLPDDLDPDDFVREFGKDEFLSLRKA